MKKLDHNACLQISGGHDAPLYYHGGLLHNMVGLFAGTVGVVTVSAFAAGLAAICYGASYLLEAPEY